MRQKTNFKIVEEISLEEIPVVSGDKSESKNGQPLVVIMSILYSNF